MPSFDVVSEVNKISLNNAVDTANKEIATRFDFKDAESHIELTENDTMIVIYANSEYYVNQARALMLAKIARYNIDPRSVNLVDAKFEKVSTKKFKEVISLINGIDQVVAKKVVKTVKDSGMKLQAAIQGDIVRVTGNKKDDLQSIMTIIKNNIEEVPVQFINFRG